jgi:hypothetical protein
MAGGFIHPLVDLLDQTGQGVAGFADEDQRDQVGAASDRTAALAGCGSSHPLRKEAAHIVPFPDLGARFQRILGQACTGKEQGAKSGSRNET